MPFALRVACALSLSRLKEIYDSSSIFFVTAIIVLQHTRHLNMHWKMVSFCDFLSVCDYNMLGM